MKSRNMLYMTIVLCTAFVITFINRFLNLLTSSTYSISKDIIQKGGDTR